MNGIKQQLTTTNNNLKTKNMKSTENKTTDYSKLVADYFEKTGINKALNEQVKFEDESSSIETKEHEITLPLNTLLKVVDVFNSMKIEHSITELSLNQNCTAKLKYKDGIAGRFLLSILKLVINKIEYDCISKTVSDSLIELMKGIEHKVKPIANIDFNN